MLGVVLRVQAVCYGAGALVAGIAYPFRRSDTPDLGGYAAARAHPVAVIVVWLAAAGWLLWLARRIPGRPPGLLRLIKITQWVLLLDGVIGILVGIFNIWWISGLLSAFVALWYARTDDTDRYLG